MARSGSRDRASLAPQGRIDCGYRASPRIMHHLPTSRDLSLEVRGDGSRLAQATAAQEARPISYDRYSTGRDVVLRRLTHTDWRRLLPTT